MPESRSWIALGVIVRPHGVQGELRVKLFNPDSAAISASLTVRLTREGSAPKDARILSVRESVEGFLLIRIDGVADRNAAEHLRGTAIELPRDVLPPPSPGEFYVCDILGADAVLSDGSPCGKVVDFRSFPTTDILVIDHDGTRYEVPLIDDFVESVDAVAGRVVIRSLDGFESS